MRPRRNDLELRSQKKHAAVHVRHRRRGTGHSRRRQTNGQVESQAGGRQQSFRTQHTIIAEKVGEKHAEGEGNDANDVRAIWARAVRYVR